MSDTRPLLARVEAARHFPENTCGASRHAEQIGEAMVLGEPYPMLDDERAYCGESILSTVASLYEARTRVAALEQEVAGLRAAHGAYAVLSLRIGDLYFKSGLTKTELHFERTPKALLMAYAERAIDSVLERLNGGATPGQGG